MLRSSGITHVVNCTHGPSKIPNYHVGSVAYYEFPISNWHNIVTGVDPTIIYGKSCAPSPLVAITVPVADFVDPLFEFIDAALSAGNSVLVHCLAGAHRAGTTGCLCLMHYGGYDVSTAIAVAKRLRPVIDPIGHLPEFLSRYHVARRMKSAAEN